MAKSVAKHYHDLIKSGLLNGRNFHVWKNLMGAMIRENDLEYILLHDPIIVEPSPETAPIDEIEDYGIWKKGNQRVKDLLITSMEIGLLREFETYPYAKRI